MKLYTDADITSKLAPALRDRGYDAVSAAEVGKTGATDPEQMAYAATHGRVILTFNIGHFTLLVQEYWNTGREHSGVVVSQQLELGELLRRVRKLMDTVPEDEMRNTLRHLAEFAEPGRKHLREEDAEYGSDGFSEAGAARPAEAITTEAFDLNRG